MSLYGINDSRSLEVIDEVPVASSTTAGKVFISNTVSDVSGENEAQTVVDKAALQESITNIQASIPVVEAMTNEEIDAAINAAG